jgi:predicted dehydrogenase
MAPLKIAIAGYGAIGKRHAEIVVADKNCELVGVSGRTTRYKEAAEKQGIPFFTNFRKMLQETRPDGLIDSTPTPEHLSIGLECAKHGVHLLVEKPITQTIGEGKQLIEAAQRAGIKLLVGHYRRHSSYYQKALRLIAEGTLGELRLVASQWTVQKPDSYYDEPWRAQAGQGPLTTNLVHDMDALRFMCGEIESVYAYTSSAARQLPFVDTLAAVVRFQSGAFATVAMSDSVPAPWAYEITAGEDPGFPHNNENVLRIMGSKATLCVPQMDFWSHPEGRRLGWRGKIEHKKVPIEPGDALARQLTHFCRVMRGEEKPLISGEDGLHSLAAVLALSASAERNAPISPNSLL